MKTYQLKYILVGLCSILFVSTLKSQNNTLMFLHGLPQTTEINPALQPIRGTYLSFPLVGSITSNLSNSGFALSDVLIHSKGKQSDSLHYNLDHLAERLQDRNILATQLSLNALEFGFITDNTMISLGLHNKIKSNFVYPSSLLDLRYGNWNYELNRPINFSSSETAIDFINYSEFVFGISTPITKKLIIGARAKYLFGAFNIKSNKMDFDIITSDNGSMEVIVDADIMVSAPIIVTTNDNGNVDSFEFDEYADRGALFTNNNQGWAFDAGLIFKPTSKLTLGLSLTDVGYIKWKENANHFIAKDSFMFEGMDANYILTDEDSDSEYWEALFDSIKNTFRFAHQITSYTTGIQGQVNLSGQYDFSDVVFIGLLSNARWSNGVMFPDLTLAGGLHTGGFFSTVITYAMRKNSFDNFGIGFAIKAGSFQLYGATDNLLSLMALNNAQTINFRIGLNLVFNKN